MPANLGGRRPQDVSGAAELQMGAAWQLQIGAEGLGREMLHRLLGVMDRVERQGRTVPGVAVAVSLIGLAFLQVARIAQDDAAQILSGRRCDHLAAITLIDQPGQIAAVIKVGVGQHYPVDTRGRHGQRPPVTLAQHLETLKEAAVDQQPTAFRFQQVARARDRSGAAQAFEGQAHAENAAAGRTERRSMAGLQGCLTVRPVAGDTV